ncbi:hypothetical protein MNBD_GAMMA09-623 [hydrothermal vent metagenome]|uniref:Zn-ribbon-containing, possibly RNA-binding protein and truncated derivatives n=1 Tax=hydrothermal vent metagenome TaxID=652676 RepID=A0A3B0Y3C8_9ZZZZ
MDNISNKLVQRIKKKAVELNELNRAIKISLPRDCHDHVQVAGIRGNQLIILTDSPVWRTRLRMMSQAMLEALHQHTGLKLHRVKLSLAPQQRIIEEPPRVKRTLSRHSSNIIIQTANCISDPKLQSALLQLARKVKKTEQAD